MAGKGTLTVKSKNLTAYCVLQVLLDFSDYKHKLSQDDIIYYLKNYYGLEPERKSLARTIGRLRDELEIDIESDKKGCWIDSRPFEDYELHVLIDGVMGSRFISAKNSKVLIEKLTALGNQYFKSNVKYTYNLDDLGKTENKSVFYNISNIEQAVAKKCRIEFDFNRYGPDKALHMTAHHHVSPYRMLIHNQRYYLMALNEKYGNIVYYRIDHITNMDILWDVPSTPITKVPGWEGGITNKKLATSLPYMYGDKQCMITMLCDPHAIDHIIDWLGFDIDIRKAEEKDGKMRLTVKSSPTAMKYFALQYLELVEIIEPKSLREDIVKSLSEGLGKYTE